MSLTELRFHFGNGFEINRAFLSVAAKADRFDFLSFAKGQFSSSVLSPGIFTAAATEGKWDVIVWAVKENVPFDYDVREEKRRAEKRREEKRREEKRREGKRRSYSFSPRRYWRSSQPRTSPAGQARRQKSNSWCCMLSRIKNGFN
jgi:hypothetical protein